MATVNKIGLDLKTFSLQAAGIGRYTTSLVEELCHRRKLAYIGFPSPQSDFNRMKLLHLDLKNGLYRKCQSTYLRSFLFLSGAIQNSKIDLFHSMDSSAVHLWGKPRCKRVSTIHDLIVFKYPEFFTRKHRTVVREIIKSAVRQADHLIAVSQSTKQDLLEQFPRLKPEHISVTHLAASKNFTDAGRVAVNEFLEKHRLPKHYFFCLGTSEPRKNHQNLINAFLGLKKNREYDEIALIIAGGKGWLGQNNAASYQEKLRRNKIYLLGFTPEEWLPLLYSGAVAFVYPSFYEGFGLPVLESISCGCPVITSNVSSLPEVAGDSAVYVDPGSTDAIKHGMKRFLDNDELRAALSTKGLQKSAQFSWQKTAQQTEQIYQAVLAS